MTYISNDKELLEMARTEEKECGSRFNNIHNGATSNDSKRRRIENSESMGAVSVENSHKIESMKEVPTTSTNDVASDNHYKKDDDPLSLASSLFQIPIILNQSQLIGNDDDDEEEQTKSLTLDKDLFMKLYDTYQCVYVPRLLINSTPSSCMKNNTLEWKDIGDLFQSLSNKDKKSWTIENTSDSDGNDNHAKNFLTREEDIYDNENFKGSDTRQQQEKDDQNENKAIQKRRRGYCSFLLQHDKQKLEETLKRLPLSNLPLTEVNKTESTRIDSEKYLNKDTMNNDDTKILRYGSCLWFFFGWNDVSASVNDESQTLDYCNNKSLEGRGEHTDSVSHHGTWHYQLSGSKEWYLRPTDELLKQYHDIHLKNNTHNNTTSFQHPNISYDATMKTTKIICREGDLLILNTRLWWHRTIIPPQQQKQQELPNISSTQNDTTEKVIAESDDSKKMIDRYRLINVPSVSYARDFYFHDKQKNCNTQSLKKCDVDDDNCSSNSSKCEDNYHDDNMTNLDGMYASCAIDAGTILFTENEMPNCELHRSKTNWNCEIVALEDDTMAVVSCRDIATGEFFCAPQTDSEDSDDSEDDGEDEEEEYGSSDS